MWPVSSCRKYVSDDCLAACGIISCSRAKSCDLLPSWARHGIPRLERSICYMQAVHAADGRVVVAHPGGFVYCGLLLLLLLLPLRAKPLLPPPARRPAANHRASDLPPRRPPYHWLGIIAVLLAVGEMAPMVAVASTISCQAGHCTAEQQRRPCPTAASCGRAPSVQATPAVTIH